MSSAAGEVRARAERALSEAGNVAGQMAKLESLEESGEISAEVAAQIRDELDGKAREIRQTCEGLLDQIRERLGVLEGEMAAKRREREVAEAKHRIGAVEDDRFRETIGALDPELKEIESATEHLVELADRLEGLLEAPNRTSTRTAGPKGPEEREEPQEPEELRQGSTVCAACGAENRPGAAFCKDCGSRLLAQKEGTGRTQARKARDSGSPRRGRVAGEVLKKGARPRRVLFLGVHSGRMIGNTVKGYDEVFHHLAKLGVEVKYEVAGGRGPQTPVRAGYLDKFGAVFALGCHNDRFDPGKILQEGEISALLGFVAGGGGLLVTPCIYGSGFNYLEVKEGLTDLCSALGIGFPVETGDLIDQSKRVRSRDDHYPGKKDDWALIEAGNHPLVAGLGKVSFGPHGGAFLHLVEGGGEPLGGVEVLLETGKGQEPPGVPVMVLSSYGEGRAVVFGSPTAFMYPELLSSNLVDNAELLERIVEMLLG